MNKRLKVGIVSIGLAAFLISCGSHNEHLSKGKELIKSDRRRKEERAVAQFKLAIRQEPTNAEAHYLLGFYDSQDFYDAESSLEKLGGASGKGKRRKSRRAHVPRLSAGKEQVS